jgi:hypothetical protein
MTKVKVKAPKKILTLEEKKSRTLVWELKQIRLGVKHEKGQRLSELRKVELKTIAGFDNRLAELDAAIKEAEAGGTPSAKIMDVQPTAAQAAAPAPLPTAGDQMVKIHPEPRHGMPLQRGEFVVSRAVR